MPSSACKNRRKLAAPEYRGKGSAIGLAGMPGGQLGREVKHIRLLVFLEALGEEGAEFRGCQPGGARQDENVDALAEPRIRPPDGQRSRHFRVRAAGTLHLERRRLVAPSVNDLLLATDDLDHAGVALARKIARRE